MLSLLISLFFCCRVRVVCIIGVLGIGIRVVVREVVFIFGAFGLDCGAIFGID